MKLSVKISFLALAATFAFSCFTLTVAAQDNSTSLVDIDKGWASKPINNVINGTLGIMLERFDQTWPTWMLRSVRNTMEKGLAKEVLDKETDLTVTVDSKNGYAAIGDGGTDGEYMSACYWNRTNGHKLLAVLLGSPTNPCIEVLCTYDYDPQKKVLTPEPDILKGYRWADRKEYSQLFIKLPKRGKTVLVDEWGTGEPKRHTFNWDGMKPVYAKTEPLDVDENGQPPIIVSFKGEQPNVKDFVSALLSSSEDDESMNGLKEAWQFYKNGMKQMPGDEIIVDVQNGYVGYVSTSEDNDRQVIECCYWNYADRRHKLVAISNDLYMNGEPVAGQFTGITFYKYDNATRKMKLIYVHELGLDTDHQAISHALPRKGKTIVLNYSMPSGMVTKRMTWNGSMFVEK